MQLFLKIVIEIAHIVDPDQTAPPEAVWSGSALFAYSILWETLVYKILGHLLSSKMEHCFMEDTNWSNITYVSLKTTQT